VQQSSRQEIGVRMALLAKRLIDSQSVTLILGSLSDEQCSRLWGQDLRQLLDSPL
jgi:hypothetical protein